MLLKLVTAPGEEPVTLAEAKSHLRVLHASEDALITTYAKAARLHVELTLGRALVTQTWDFWLPKFPDSGVIELPKPPLQSVTWVKYREDGIEQTLDAAAYTVVAPGLIGFLEEAPEATWPATQAHPQAVNVRFVAGFGNTSSDVPDDLRVGLLLLIEHLYHNRGATTAEALKSTPMGIESLLGSSRTFGWGPSQVMNDGWPAVGPRPSSSRWNATRPRRMAAAVRPGRGHRSANCGPRRSGSAARK